VRARSIRQVVVSAVALAAVLGIVFGAVTGCGSEQADAPPAAGAPADQQGGADPLAATGGPLAAAGQGAAALAALGGLGQAQGAGEPVRDLGAQLAAEGQALLDQLRESAGGTLDAQPTAQQQAALAGLRGRTGEQFDQAWLRAATDAQQQARDAANAVLAGADASDEAKAAARDAITRLDALDARIQQAAGSAGAGTPETVDAGSGGQAAADDPTPAAVVLVGIGVALLAGALSWRRRAA